MCSQVAGSRGAAPESVPWLQVELAAVDPALGQSPDRHSMAEVDMDAAVVLAEHLPGFEQAL